MTPTPPPNPHGNTPTPGDTGDDVKSYYGLNTDKKRRERRKTIAVAVISLVLIGFTIYLLVKPLVQGWNEDVHSQINPPGTSDGKLTPAPSNGRDSSRADGSSGNGQDDNDGSSAGDSDSGRATTAEELNLPATQTGSWTRAVNPADTVTRDTQMKKHIAGLIASAREELQGVGFSETDVDGTLMDVANYYFYGNESAVMGLMKANAGMLQETKDSLTVYDHAREGVYSFTYVLYRDNGQPGYLMSGWYDPTSDSLKVDTASDTH